MCQKENNAAIRGRITVKGILQLDTPLLIAEGASSNERGGLDIHVLQNRDGVPFIPGTSLAGVLRSAVKDDNVRNLLFGTIDEENPQQSAVLLYDVLLANAKIGVRDGVSIDPVTGTAIKGYKYDYEVVEKGAKGDFYAEIVLRQIHVEQKEALTKELRHLCRLLCNGFHVGALTTKGFGLVRMAQIDIDCYDFSNPDNVAAWLAPERKPAVMHWDESDFLEADQDHPRYAADDFMIEADFALTGALIVRDADGAMTRDDNKSIAAVMKKSGGAYIIPGTSLKGVLRHRAAYILHALGMGRESADDLLDSFMGTTAVRSRFVVEETIIDAEAHPQTRNRIDRFTGGTIKSALFSTEPVWRKTEGGSSVTLCFGVHRARDWEAGLCVLLLKDLWLGRIAIGGEKSIGRGTLEGLRAVIHDRGRSYELTQGQPFDTETMQILENYVTVLHQMQAKEVEA